MLLYTQAPCTSMHAAQGMHKPAAAITGSAITAQPETMHVLRKLDERAGPVFGIMRGHQHI